MDKDKYRDHLNDLARKRYQDRLLSEQLRMDEILYARKRKIAIAIFGDVLTYGEVGNSYKVSYRRNQRHNYRFDFIIEYLRIANGIYGTNAELIYNDEGRIARFPREPYVYITLNP